MSGITASSLASPALASPMPSPAASYSALGARPRIDPKVRAREQAIDFEAVFLNNMFSQMFTGMDGDGPFGGGKAGVWRSFLTDEYSKSFAKSGGIGIADQVYRGLIAQQEIKQ